MARIAVLGASGMLGHKVCQELSKRGHEVIGTVRLFDPNLEQLNPSFETRKGIDALEGTSLECLIREIKVEFVVNAIGIVKQLASATDKWLNTAINAFLPHRLSRVCRETGTRLIHISTDCVFDGTKGNYTESDPSDARDLYGRSKWLGEPDVKETAALTFRTSVIGRELKRPTHGLVEWFLDQNGKHVQGFARALFTGVTTIELAKTIAFVVERHPKLQGLYHLASERISKLDLLKLLKQGYGLSVEVQREDDFVCDRSLIMKAFTERTGYTVATWPEMIREMCTDTTPYDAIQSITH
jgi:dTDP-4-dehydrorhamnose reductase